MSTGVLETLDHVVVVVRDLDAAAADYTLLFGRGPSWRGNHPDQGSGNVLYQLENTYVELLSPIGSGALADSLRQRLAGTGEGPAALAFGTSAAAEFAAAMNQSNVPVSVRSSSGVDATGASVRSWRMVMLPDDATRGVTLFAIEHHSQSLVPAPLWSAEREAVSAVDHVVILSADVESTKGIYGDLLGLRLALDREFAERGVRLLFFRVGGVSVEVGGRLGSTPEPALPVADEVGENDKFWGVAYRVADIDATRERLRRAGVDVSTVRNGNKKGTRVCTVKSHVHGVATLLIGPESV